MTFVVVMGLALTQFLLALLAPVRLVYLTLLIGAMPWFVLVEGAVDTPVGSLNGVSLQLFTLCIAAIVVLVANAELVSRYFARCRWHFLFAAFCALSLVYAPSFSYGLRTLAKLLGPAVICMMVMVSVRTPQQLAMTGRTIFISGIMLCILAYVSRAMGLDSRYNGEIPGLGPPGMGPPVFAAHMLVVSMFALSTFLSGRRLWALGLTVLFAVSLLGAVQRTTAAAMMIGFSVIMFFGSRGLPRLVMPAASILGLPLLMIFNDGFRKRMFFTATDPDAILKDPGTALQGLDGSGRFGLWDVALQKFFTPSPVLGSGIGATQHFLQQQGTDQKIGVVHSEYVRLLCEVGLIGLVLFLIAMGVYLARLRFLAATTPERKYALAAMGALIGYMLYMATDNSFDYVNQFGAYVFALIALSEKAKEFASATSEEAAPAVTLSLRPVNLMQ